MKKLVSLVLVVLMALSLTSCKAGRIMYNDVNLQDYVEMSGDYKDITVDTDSDDFKTRYNTNIENDIKNNNLYEKKTEGTIAEGDTANIDYVGKKDGVAFQGGTAEGYDLEIGSGTFIDGFESGLIGAEIGSTVDLNLTFPESYGNADLAGQDVVFTVKINYVNSSTGLKPEEYYKELGFKSLKKYEEDVRSRTINSFIYDAIDEMAVINEYPEKDEEYLNEISVKMIKENIKDSYGMTFEEYLTQSQMTEESFAEAVMTQQVYPLMDQTMPIYYILDQEKVKISKKDVDAKVKEYHEKYSDGTMELDEFREYYGEYYFECGVADDKVLEIIKEYANLK